MNKVDSLDAEKGFKASLIICSYHWAREVAENVPQISNGSETDHNDDKNANKLDRN